jgi:prophage regulatory protein
LNVQPLRIIRLPELITKTGMSRTRIYAAMAEGKFPAPKRLPGRSVGWVEGVINDWIVSLPSARVEADGKVAN